VVSTRVGYRECNKRLAPPCLYHHPLAESRCTQVYPSPILIDAEDLIVHLGFRGPCTQVPAVASLVVTLMLDGDFGEMAEDVLHLGVRSATALAAEVVKPRDPVHEEVDNGDDDLMRILC